MTVSPRYRSTSSLDLNEAAKEAKRLILTHAPIFFPANASHASDGRYASRSKNNTLGRLPSRDNCSTSSQMNCAKAYIIGPSEAYPIALSGRLKSVCEEAITALNGLDKERLYLIVGSRKLPDKACIRASSVIFLSY